MDELPGIPSNPAKKAVTEQVGAVHANVEEHPSVEGLTQREHDVFELLIKGKKMREIADELGIKYSTVNTHQKSVYKKLGVTSRVECILRYGALETERK
ncbi:MAG: helix-turn-helix transcriptional regulator [Ruminococcaceae bacterium]|nr:helix-turn-helix transcriptional regulator [Oscillospiraceae bacterium]